MCNLRCAKISLFVFHLFFWVAGAAAVGLGIWTLQANAVYEAFLGDSGYDLSSWMMIGVGIFVLLVGFLGCCGAIMENRCMLGWFFAFMFVIYCLEIAAGVLVFYNRDREIYDEVERNVKDFIVAKYDASADNKLDYNVNKLQEKLECCGVDGFKDWENSEWYKNGDKNKKVPKSCCKSPATTNCTIAPTDDNVFTQGCEQALIDFLERNMILIGSLMVVIAAIQLFGMIFTCCLFCRIDED